jgi:hypothetical protein
MMMKCFRLFFVDSYFTASAFDNVRALFIH